MDLIRFCRATGRNTQCYRLNIAGAMLVISYETIVAAAYHGERIRRYNCWGPTTGRHLRETSTDDYDVIDDAAQFDARVNQMVLTAIAELVKQRVQRIA